MTRMRNFLSHSFLFRGSGVLVLAALLIVKRMKHLALRVGKLRSVTLRVCRVRVCRETRIWWGRRGAAACGGWRARRARCCPRSEARGARRPPRPAPTCRTCRTRRTCRARRRRRRPAPVCPTYPTCGRRSRPVHDHVVNIRKNSSVIQLYIHVLRCVCLSSRHALNLLMYRKGIYEYYKIISKIILNLVDCCMW